MGPRLSEGVCFFFIGYACSGARLSGLSGTQVSAASFFWFTISLPFIVSVLISDFMSFCLRCIPQPTACCYLQGFLGSAAGESLCTGVCKPQVFCHDHYTPEHPWPCSHFLTRRFPLPPLPSSLPVSSDSTGSIPSFPLPPLVTLCLFF